jgi:DNA-binding MarR family transcriptional regulator
VTSLAAPQNSKTKLQDLWTYQTVALADKISRLSLVAARSEAGLNLSQWRVLAALADQPKRTAAEVVSITPMDKGIVSRSVDALIKVGLIKKTPDKNDKRRATLSLTPSGRKTYLLISNRIEGDFEAVTNAEIDTADLVQILTQINQLLPAKS